jgi:predicted transcriptional regulator YheO
MQKVKSTFSAHDRAILETYKTTANGLAAFLGEAFEILLYSLEDTEHAILSIFNGFHSGRKVGGPITDIALDMLEKIRQNNGSHRKKVKPEPYVIYVSGNKYGKPVHCATIVIFGDDGTQSKRRPIGLLCINLYLDSPVSAFASLVSGLGPLTAGAVEEKLGPESDWPIEKALEKVRGEVEADDTVPQFLKNKEIIYRLYYRGIFKLKNSVITVSDNLGISKNTVYLHLRQLEKKV